MVDMVPCGAFVYWLPNRQDGDKPICRSRMGNCSHTHTHTQGTHANAIVWGFQALA